MRKDGVMRSITKNDFGRASAILKQHHEILEKAAKLLLEHETLDQAERQKCLQHGQKCGLTRFQSTKRCSIAT